MKTRKTPYTTTELFSTILTTLKDNNLLPDTLEYASATRNEYPLTSYKWDTICHLAYGESEGIYLDVFAVGMFDGESKHFNLGTFKTLGQGREDMYIMAKLQADIIIEITDFVNHNLDDFTWEGYDVEFFVEGKKKWGYTVSDKSAVDHLIKRPYPQEWEYALVINNKTGKEERINFKDIL